MEKSRRQELREYLETGMLRDAVAGQSPPPLSAAAQDLLVDIVARYCEDRPRRRRSRGGSR